MNITAIKELTTHQWWWLFIAWWRLWVVQIKLKVNGVAWFMPQVNDLGDKVSRNAAAAIANDERKKAELMYTSVRLAERCHPLSIACLGKSLVLYQMLRRQKVAARIKVGVNLNKQSHMGAIPPSLASHAWVELGGVPIGEPESIQNEFIEVGGG